MVQHNLLSNFSSRQLGINTANKLKSMEKLGSGYRINKAGDDAAGLTITENMRAQIRGLNQADQNIQDGVSLLHTADGALSEIDSLLHRMGELSVKSANDTYTAEDRENMNDEFVALKKEINRISRQTEFNTQKVIFDDTVTVGGNPDDVKVYTANSGEYGGIVYKGVRYDWSKFLSESGGSSLDSAVPKTGDYYLDTVEGTRLHFSMDKGMDIPNISKKYDINAEQSQIKIDDYTYPWSDVEDEDGVSINTAKPKEGLYSLEHKGSIIEFYVSDGDSIDDIVMQLNESGAGEATSWESKLNEIEQQPAVFDLNLKAGTIDIDSSNQNSIHASDYTIHADATGIQIDGNEKVSWEDLTFIPAYYTGETAGIDFANGKGIGHDTEVSFQCPDSDISFSFRISSEASLNEVIAGLNNVTVPASVDAPMQGQLTFDPSGIWVMTGVSVSGLNISYETQRDGLGLNFDADSWINAASLSTGFDINYAGTTFGLDNAELTKLDNFFRNGTDDTVQLTYRNTLSENISINFSRNNTTDGSRPLPSDTTAMNSYVTNLIDNFKTQFSTSTFGLKSDNASLQLSNMDENPMGSGNASDAIIFGVKPKEPEPIYVQAGSNQGQSIALKIDKVGTAILGISREGIDTRDSANNYIKIIRTAVETVSKTRSKIGAYENQLGHALNNVNNTSENLQNAESKIRDADMAAEMVIYSKNSILEQAAQAVLTQANQSSQGVLALLK